MLKGWARFMYGNRDTLVEAGDCVHQRPGIVHFLYDYSPDMEYLESSGRPTSHRRHAGTGAVPDPDALVTAGRDGAGGAPWPEVHVELFDVVGLGAAPRRPTPASPASPSPSGSRRCRAC
jgi:hypothetical protein